MSTVKKYRVLIADDSLPDREFLEIFINDRKELELGASFTNGADAFEILNTERFDLLILDINMPGYSGVEIVEKIKKDHVQYIIFATGEEDYALKAFDFGAVDYLLKPFSRDRFNKAIDRFLDAIAGDSIRSSFPNGFSFKDGNKHFTIAYNDIIFISSRGKRSVLHCVDRDYETAMLLKVIHEKLPNPKFTRIHKQYLVNIQYFHGIQYDKSGYYSLHLNDDDDSILPVGRSYVEIVKDILGIR